MRSSDPDTKPCRPLLPRSLFSIHGSRCTAESPSENNCLARASRMLDVNGGSTVRGAVILIQDEKITAAGSSLKIPADAQIVDLGEATLLPGLITESSRPRG